MSKFNYLKVSGIEKFTFYRMPKLLFTDDYFIGLSCEAKVLYGLLLDRATLSKSNDWIDEYGRVFVFFKQTEVMEMLNIKKNKVIAIFKELEEIGLIIRKKLGQGNPTRIYVLNFSEFTDNNNPANSETSNENTKKEVKRFEKPTSEIQTSNKNTKKEVKRFEKPTSKGLKNKFSSSNYINNTEINDNESIYLSGKGKKPTSENNQTIQGLNDEEYEELVSDIKKQISYDYLIEKGYEVSTINLIISIISDAYQYQQDINVNGKPIPANRVIAEYKKLDERHIDFVLKCVNKISADQKITNIRTYLQSCLYNAPNTIDIFYETQVNFDFGYGNL